MAGSLNAGVPRQGRGTRTSNDRRWVVNLSAVSVIGQTTLQFVDGLKIDLEQISWKMEQMLDWREHHHPIPRGHHIDNLKDAKKLLDDWICYGCEAIEEWEDLEWQDLVSGQYMGWYQFLRSFWWNYTNRVHLAAGSQSIDLEESGIPAIRIGEIEVRDQVGHVAIRARGMEHNGRFFDTETGRTFEFPRSVVFVPHVSIPTSFVEAACDALLQNTQIVDLTNTEEEIEDEEQ